MIGSITRRRFAVYARLVIAGALTLGLALPAAAQTTSQPATASPARVTHANWVLSNRFDPTALRSVTYSTAVQARWIGQTDSLFYNWRDHSGSRFYLVVPVTSTKRPLFDHAKLAAALTSLAHKPFDETNLPFTTLNFTKNHKAVRFFADSARYEWDLATETLKSVGRMRRDSALADEEHERVETGGRGGGGGGRAGGAGEDFRNFSPDSTVFVFARNHNLYLVEVGRPDTVQITTDGVKDYSYGFRDTTQLQLQQQQDDQGGGRGGPPSRDPRVRAAAIWSPDSKAFAIIRTDQRKVKDLYLVNVLAEPRPTLMAYKYAMPGEEIVPQQELMVFHRADRKISELNLKKWRDQRLMDVHWTTGSDNLRLVRRDRTQRNLDLIEVNVATNNIKPLLSESMENANLEPQPVRYMKKGGDFLWWSERSGWGHYYVYDFNGTYKHPLTSGPWRAASIVDIDTARGVVFVSGGGREAGENPYFKHLYRVNGDGTGFAAVDAGNYNHTSAVSPSKKYFVDNYSRPDYVPKSVLRDALTGKVAMDLEETDVTRLKELGWRLPETFVVKAADGVTDIYGNLWKPFDFDSTKKYPIIAHVYPGPQTEEVNAAFVAAGVQQQLAQLGFIVIQIGNRGGSPERSLAYHRYGYYNLRDYALADKKTGIEQLAARHPYIDVERVGIFGHSGGGFLTAAALLEPPYNDFFKVGVSSSGNHDNNIYNQNWSESNHGLKVIAARADTMRATQAGRRRGGGGAPASVADTGLVDDTLRYLIHVPTNEELAANLKGNLLLTTGDMDNNVHPGNTIRLVNALIKANKRFDFMVLPGKPHGYGDMQPYFNHMMMEYFSEHLLADYYRGGAAYLNK